MKYYALVGTSKNPISVDKDTPDKVIQNHLKFLQKGFGAGTILVAGPNDSGGGFIIMKAINYEEV
ncbi:hypothetical protein ACIQ34_07290 [Ureibacillus sp. NPDC094379]